ncbi:MAG: integration host factor subunit beta [Pedosphaera sp.]|nr:integration host factor subunit beta [Pedosphaera sp.]
MHDQKNIVSQIGDDSQLTQTQILKVIQQTLDVISESVAAGKTVELRNFGVFELKLQKARTGRNQKNPAANLRIPARFAVKFKPGKEMKKLIKQPIP